MSDDRPLILWDIDDTLNRQIEIFMEHSPLAAGREYKDITLKPQYLSFGCTREEYLAELDRCRREFIYCSEPRQEMLEFFREYGHSFRSITLSAVPISIAPLSAAWVLKHFGPWIQGTLYVPSKRTSVPVHSRTFQSKAEAVIALNGILVDDTNDHLEPTWQAGGRGYCFPAPWNQNADMPIADFLQQLIDELGLKK